mmetsp:Transcript_40349/g.60504  ORF Transcript_40349/g.60504 Transcript_40349/m.60504 type:complete len:102 (+) Transcript_40349:2302-2607(+)
MKRLFVCARYLISGRNDHYEYIMARVSTFLIRKLPFVKAQIYDLKNNLWVELLVLDEEQVRSSFRLTLLPSNAAANKPIDINVAHVSSNDVEKKSKIKLVR